MTADEQSRDTTPEDTRASRAGRGAGAEGGGSGDLQRPRPGSFWELYDSLAERLDQRTGWDKLQEPLGLLTLVGLRNILRRRNLYDTTGQPSVNAPQPQDWDPSVLTQRSPDGSWNDLEHPAMGMAGSRFGRNVPIEHTWPEDEEHLLEPNPRLVSRRLLTREEFVPAPGGNALIATWLQFMVRDWMRHGASPTDNPWVLPVEPGDDWPEPTVTVLRTPPDPTTPAGPSAVPPTHVNVMTHWWDGSQVYGTSAADQDFLRAHEGGRLRIEAGMQPYPTEPDRDPRLVPGFWLGLASMQTLFAHEHNAICGRLAEAYPGWSDEELFQRARLVNAGLLAKIHTVEWTPAVIAHPTTQTAMHANWYGLAGRRLHNAFGRIGSNEVLAGIPGSETEHYGVPYALTEEFVAVYRMHPLIPDDYDFRRARDDSPTLGPTSFAELIGTAATDILRDVPLEDVLYSFGTRNAGLVTLHNYPRFLQTFRRPDGHLMDLAATDILRIREMGVPRYTEFRRLMHLTVPTTFDELTDNPDWAREISEVYGGDIDRVDLMVGMFAERRPQGFAFSDTAFRVFILMASRRLNSDRFFTRDFTPAVYTPEGMAWIDDNTMSTVLLRHCPGLRPALRGVSNAFALWPDSSPPWL